jgi:hypothetical protein
VWLLCESTFRGNVSPPLSGCKKQRDKDVIQLLVSANIARSSLILFALMMETISSSETSVLKERHGIISDDGMFHVTCCCTPA